MTKFDDNILWDSYNNLLLSPDTSRLKKLITRYELFKLSENIPGDIIECGVFKGAGWMYWLKLLNTFSRGEQKKVIGFDTFSSFASSLLDYEKKSAQEFVEESEFSGSSPEELLNLSLNAGFKNCELVSGDVIETIPEYVKLNPGFRISLLNLDTAFRAHSISL